MADIRNYRIYLAKGRSLDAARQCQQMMQQRHEAISALAKEVGADSAVTSCAVIGFIFEGEPPVGWKRKGLVDDRPYYAPERRKKTDRALWKRMNDLRPIRAEDFARLLGRGIVFTDEPGRSNLGMGVVMRTTTFEAIGKQIIILVPTHDRDETPPPDAEPIKASDYWVMREQANAA